MRLADRHLSIDIDRRGRVVRSNEKELPERPPSTTTTTTETGKENRLRKKRHLDGDTCGRTVSPAFAIAASIGVRTLSFDTAMLL